MAISVIAMSILIDSVSAKTYYASPKGGGDGSSVESPFAVEDFWDDAQPGDTLILLDGLYTGPRSMVKPPENLSGTKDLPITVRALCDGKVTIDGKCFLRPVALNHNDWWIIEGINACNSKSTVVGLSRSNHCIVECAVGTQPTATQTSSRHTTENTTCLRIVPAGVSPARRSRARREATIRPSVVASAHGKAATASVPRWLSLSFTTAITSPLRTASLLGTAS
jgi:hypothetical protein